MTTSRALLYCAGGGIGDSLVASMVARALHRRFANVAALTLEAHRQLLERVPDIDDVIVDDGGDEPRARAPAARCSLRGMRGNLGDTANRSRSADGGNSGARRAGAPHLFFSLYRPGRRAQRKWRRDLALVGDPARLRPRHRLRHRRPAVSLRADRRRRARGAELSAGSGRFIILNPCNAVASRRGIWPLEGWATLARTLRERFDARILVSGARADAPIAESIVRLSRDDAVVSIAGRTASAPSERSRAERTPSSVSRPARCTSQPRSAARPSASFRFSRTFPNAGRRWEARMAVVRASYPCHEGDTKESCRDYACIAHLDVSRILAAVASLRS